MRTPWGDCGTVVNLFLKVAKDVLGVDGLTKGSVTGVENHFWTTGAPIVDAKRKSGNVAGKYWFWTSHVWAKDSSGKVYDVLFNKTYPSEEKMKATVWHVIDDSMKQTFKVGTKSFTKYVVKPTLIFYANSAARFPPTHQFVLTPPKGVAGPKKGIAPSKAAPKKKKIGG